PKIISSEVYFNNKLIERTNESSTSISIYSDTLSTGKYAIKTIAKNSDGKIGVNYSSVSIVSNIKPEQLSYKIIETLPHNSANYTEGFEFYDNDLLEGTGNYNESFIYSYKPKSDKINKSIKNDNQYFGEGITVLNNKLYQLTYKSQKGFVYNAKTFEKINEFSFTSKEGWGLTNNGSSLIMSNGSSIITYLNPNTFKIEKTIEVSTPKGFVSNLNELEFVDGVIYANIWTTETIVKFDAKTGRVLAFINMNGLLNNFTNNRIDVLNGIAYEPNEKLFYVTGKWWPKMYKVIFQ
ncbi:MAG: glutaminyl-peptide cyclotransferase, partial [Bacteroidales bacterium]|nr:glutaminyl-peptide cyclotransferase [Bacteroidales bacterium]